ncbi:MAG: GerMN domain-containing protein [Christensenellales bacterium]
MLSPYPRQAETRSLPVTLYFRYGSSASLGREQRLLAVPANGSYELALVQALVEGPGSLSVHLSPLFPPGTQALSAVSEGGTLFVTFNETLMGQYPDEALLTNQVYRAGEGRLRRRLAMAALVNTLTETGLFRAVQVLVRGETYVASSMRLSMRYYLEDSDLLPDPLVRQESCIQSPRSAVQTLMEAWQTADWSACYPLLISGTSPLPSQHELSSLAQAAPKLLDYQLTAGTVSLDGASAIVCVSCTILRANGSTQVIEALPLHLLMKDGIYRIPYEGLQGLMELEDE